MAQGTKGPRNALRDDKVRPRPQGASTAILELSRDLTRIQYQPYVIVSGLSNAPQEEGEVAFNSFAALGPVQTTGGQIPWTQACHLLDAGNAIPNNKILGGAHIDKFDARQVQKTYETWQEWNEHAPYSGIMYEFYHSGKVAEVPIENAAFVQRHELKTVFCACMGFTDDFLPHARDAMINLKKVVSGSSSAFAQESLGYVNYGDAYCTLNETDEYARHFFKSNYPRLQEIKKKYDPEGVFNRWFAIKPAP
ncbi:hypothetical protein FRB90_008273 [Tulasnella sp. 427]|nr:hypothetical protein FRB90_008273 [Tulasnella sp. 427]